MKKNAKLLNELAVKLALNCVNISLWDLVNSERNVYQTVFKPSVLTRKTIDRPERFIVIVGAGASHDAYSKLQLGAAAAKDLREHFEAKLGTETALIEEELDRLERVFRLNKKDFETILLALSKFFPKELKAEISKRYSHRYYPSLTFEIIAHLMKHRFIDAVINFNFDELLDQAIADELGAVEYKKVIAEGDYDESSIKDDTGLKYPIYLKPHGTSSNPSSLRFTREDYFSVPPGIGKLIKELLGGVALSIGNEKETEITPVNLIVIGFDMQSFEFNTMFEDYCPPDSRIYFINTKIPPPPPLPQEENKDKLERRKAFLRHFDEENFIEIKKTTAKKEGGGAYTKESNLDVVLETLWKNIENCFDENYRPRGINRHILISRLFKEHELIQPNSALEYLKDRTWVELVISIAKYKGFVSIYQLQNDRFGEYFMRYLQEIKRQSTKNFDPDIYPQTILGFCKGIGMSPLSYSGKAFILTVHGSTKTKDPNGHSLTVDLPFFEQHLPQLFNKLLEKVHRSTRLMLENSLDGFFKSTLLSLFKKEDSEVSPRYDYGYNSLFKAPRVIKTFLAMDYYTRSYFKKNNWNALMVVAETGEWILEKLEKFSNKKLLLVIADNVKAEELQDKISNENQLELFQLPWWLHNQHMTIFLSGEAPNYKPVQAIYFTRHNRSPHIHPIILDQEEDFKLLLESFAAYCRKSDLIKFSEKQAIPAFVVKDDIDTFFAKYFGTLVQP